MKNLVGCFAVTAAVLILLGAFSFYLPILCGSELPEVTREAIKTQARGLYSRRLPLIPVLVRVDEFSEESVCYTIFYFPFGSVGMSYHIYDGYNIEKSLSRI